MAKFIAVMMMTLTVLFSGTPTNGEDLKKMDGIAALKSKKVLIVYYSYSGNTREIANQIKSASGGDIFEIIPASPYPSEYRAVVDQAKKEINAGFKPEIKGKVDKIRDYDVIFIGSPNWWSTIAPPVLSFLCSHDLSGKTVVPFFTHGGGSIGRCETDVRKNAPDATVLKSLYISGSSAKNAQGEVLEYLQNLSIK